MDKTNKRNPRRESGGLRSDRIQQGAFIIQFAEPAAAVDMFRRVVSPSIQPPSLLSGAGWQSAVDSYRTMERKGFLVTKDTGCLIPHSQYSTYQAGATLKGHQRTFQFFGRWKPEPGDLRNEFGWPSTPQISHLCHRRGCCRPDHLIAEEQWRNIKRTYCGHDGACDCGSEIKCIKRYQMDAQTDSPEFCSTREEVVAILKDAPRHTVHSPDLYANRDAAAKQRKANRDSRKRKQEKHAFETKRKQTRLSASQGEGEEQEESDDHFL